MKKSVYFDKFRGEFWPSPDDLYPYFSDPSGKNWFHENGGNDSASIDLLGVNGTGHLPEGEGRRDIYLNIWGYPGLGVLLIYELSGKVPVRTWNSKGDMTRIREFVRSTHDTPLPAGLFIPFAEAFKAVKEFMETEGALPKSIEWVRDVDLPENSFPDP